MACRWLCIFLGVSFFVAESKNRTVDCNHGRSHSDGSLALLDLFAHQLGNIRRILYCVRSIERTVLAMYLSAKSLPTALPQVVQTERSISNRIKRIGFRTSSLCGPGYPWRYHHNNVA